MANTNGSFILEFTNNGNDISSPGCNFNFNSQTIYSQPNNLILTTSIGQSPLFGGNYSLDLSFLK